MQDVRKIRDDLYWVGGSDRRLALFENAFPVPNGIAYNAYLVLDEKTVLLDTVDQAVSGRFFENLAHALHGRPLDYLIVNHMEPDHCATMDELVLRYPEVTIVCNAKTLTMIQQFFTFEIKARAKLVGEGDTLKTGRHSFSFYMAPMVHWPEVMVTYDAADKALYSADAFGTFGALNGNLFADEVDFAHDWLAEARRYYANIVGKYGTQVQALLKKAQGLDIELLCPLHGPIWRRNIHWFMEKYRLWGTYTPEEDGVLIAYASVYGNTQNAAEILAGKLAETGVRNIAMFDVSVTHPSYIVSEAFRFSHLVFASTTYNAGIFCNMETLLLDLKAHNLQNRTVALIENGSWAATSGRLMTELMCEMKNMTVLNGTVSLKSSVKDAQAEQLDALAAALAESLHGAQPPAQAPAEQVEPNALFKLSYGLFVLTAREESKDNGCIINTMMQVTDVPKRIAVAVNKANLTHDMIAATGVFNVSVLTEEAPFKVFQHFGFQSGRDTDKFAGCADVRTANGVRSVPKNTNAVLSGKVLSAQDCGTHTLFFADVTEAHVLSEIPSATYEYYFSNIKPKPQPPEKGKKGWVCKICGYVYEGEILPPDFICPLCKHGAADFEPLK
ncbi:MAG: flavin reductase [Ruthenibacterium sp.]